MNGNKSGRGWINAILIFILIADLFMIILWVLTRIGFSPVPCYPASLQLAGFLLVLAAVCASLVENNMKGK